MDTSYSAVSKAPRLSCRRLDTAVWINVLDTNFLYCSSTCLLCLHAMQKANTASERFQGGGTCCMGAVANEELPPADGLRIVHRSLEGATDMENADSPAANCDLH